jgi:outer membrane protein TolC
VRANIDLNRARREEAQAVYEKTVLTALNEVEAALLALVREEETRQTLADAVNAGQREVELATGRYRAGLAGFLDVLQGERALYQSKDQLVQSEQQLAVNLVALFKALGGGWGMGVKTALVQQSTPTGDLEK